MSAVFDIRRLVNFSPSQHTRTSKSIIQAQGNASHLSRLSAHTSSNSSLAWTPDGTRLLSAGKDNDPTIREWDSLTWQLVGHPWKGHTGDINAIAIHPTGTLAASASYDKHIRLWRLSDQQTIANSSRECIKFVQ
jgi:WD40 repeat protein